MRAKQNAIASTSTTPVPAPAKTTVAPPAAARYESKIFSCPCLSQSTNSVGNGAPKPKENGIHNTATSPSGNGISATSGPSNPTLSNNDAAGLKDRIQAQKIAALLQEKLLHQQTVERLESEKKGLDEKLAKQKELHDKELEELKKEVEDAREALADRRAAGANLVSRLQIQLIEAQTENEALKKEEAEWRDQEREHRETILLSQKEIERLEEEKALLNDELGTFEKKVQELAEKDRFWRQDQMRLSERVAELEKMLREVGTKSEGEEGKIAALQSELHQKDEKHRSEMKVMNNLLSEQVEACKKLANQVKALEQQKIKGNYSILQKKSI